MAVVLETVIEYILRFPFFCIVYEYWGSLLHPSGGEYIGIVFSVFFERGYMEVRFLSIYAAG